MKEFDHSDIRNIAILGSTGSIGTQALDIVERYPRRFRAYTLVARSQWQLLAKQARRFLPHTVVIADHRFESDLRQALADLPIRVLSGTDAIAQAASMPEVHTVLTAMVGYSGLIPTIEAIKAGKRIALANKETLVVGGQLITGLLKGSPSEIIPVDSEHSAIFQCLVGEKQAQASKIILTASGGPFRTWSASQIEKATLQDALKHPNWSMGAKVTVDSASMMNKGFEMIEARWLFDCPPARIEVAVHPQSIVHSMVQFNDGSVKAQLSLPDMHLPIQYALSYPERLCTQGRVLELDDYARLTFERPDLEKFPLLGMAYDAVEAGGNAPCILNAANEVAVAAFLEGKLRFADIARVVGMTLETVDTTSACDLDTLVHTNSDARRVASSLLTKFDN